MEVFENTRIFIHDLDESSELKEEIELYTIDRYDSLIFKIATMTNAVPADIYCCIEQDGINYFLWQYFVNGKEIDLESPAIISKLEKNDGYMMLGKIPVDRKLFTIAEENETVNKFKVNKKFLGEFLNIKKEVKIHVLIISSLGRGINIDEMMNSTETQKVLKLGFVDKYFPFRSFIKTDYEEWVKTDNKLEADRSLFYKEEEKIFKEYFELKNTVEEWKTKYFVRYLDFTLSFWGAKFDLKNMFNHLLLRGSPEIDNLSYFFSRNGSWFVASKSLSALFKEPEKTPNQELVEGDSDTIRFKISEHGQLNLRLEIGELFDEYPPPEFFEKKTYEVEAFLERINKIYYKFANKKLKGDIAQSEVTVRYTSFTQCETPEIKGYFEYFVKFLEKYEQLFVYDKNEETFMTELMSHGDEIIKFNLDGNSFEVEYNGEVCSYGECLSYIFLVMMLGQNVENHQASGQQTTLLSKRLLKNDPILFGNLVDSIYSRICEGLREPEFVGPEEKDEPYVYKYWNFTTNEPQYYKCNKNYKYLSFKVGQHKNNLCIPCCSDTDPEATKKRKLIYDQCIEQRTAVKQKTESNYIFRNINKFMLERYTILEQEFEEFVGKDMYIYCLTMPLEKTSSMDAVQSLVKSVAYLISLDVDTFLHEFEIFYKSGVESEDFMHELINLREKSLFQEFDMFEWKLNLEEFIGKMYNANLFMLDTKNNVHEINYIDAHHENDLIVRQTGEIYNPVVEIEGEDVVKLQPSDRSVSAATKKATEDRQNNDMEKIKFILDTEKNLFPIAQMLNERGLCKYIISKFKTGRYMLMPVNVSVPLSDVPSAKGIDPTILETYATVEEVLNIAKHYAGDIEYLIEHNNNIKAFVKKTLIFYIPETPHKKLPEFIKEHSIMSFDYDPLEVNITVFNKLNFNRDFYAEALRSVYETHIYELLEICMLEKLNVTQGSESMSIAQAEGLKPDEVTKPTTWKELEQKIKNKLENLQGNEEIDEMGTLYTCRKNPNEFFCDEDKLLIVPELEYLIQLLKEEVNEKSFDINEFTKGLFIMIGKFEFKQGPGEMLQIKQLSTKGAE